MKKLAIKSISAIEIDEIKMSGKIWIGDPCYVICGKAWSTMCELMFSGESGDCYQIEFTDGAKYQLFLWSTAYGDGGYPVRVQNEVVGNAAVDSGTLSFIPQELVDRLVLMFKDNCASAGVSITLGAPEVPEHSNGEGRIGSVSVPTDDIAEEDESDNEEAEIEALDDEEEK